MKGRLRISTHPRSPVGLVENGKRTEPSSDGLYFDYRASSLGESILEHDVRELLREE